MPSFYRQGQVNWVYLTFPQYNLQYWSWTSLFLFELSTGPFAFIFSTAIFLCTLYAMHMTLFATSLGLTIETAIGLFYLLVTCILCIPRIPFAESMNHIWRLLRLCFFPGTTISFSEVLFADALTSMSKVFKDLGVTLVAVYCYANGRNILDFHNHAMILIAVLASLPYWYVKCLFSCQKTFLVDL